MIWDRTLYDVNKSRELRERGLPFTEAEIAILERGTLTTATLNRIENKQAELVPILNYICYYGKPIANKKWADGDLFNIADFERIVTNDHNLKEMFFEYNDTPITPSAEYRFNNINALEKILYDIERMISDVRARWLECGTFECGEVV